MQLHCLFCYIKLTFEYVCTLEDYRGREAKTLHVTCGGKSVTSICPKRLKLFTQLQYLYIVSTSLEAIPDGIEHLHNLRLFEYFCNNGIGKDKDIAKLAGLKNLAIINLSNNKIKEIPACFRSFEKVTKDELTCNNLNFIGLKQLNFRNNQIQEIPVSLFSLNALEKLDISKNNISVIPPEIGLLLNLKELICKKNKIRILPSEIGNLVNLKVFDASETAIEKIPGSFVKLASLKKLILSKNAIKTIPPFIAGLRNLEVLDISYNSINYIPPKMSLLLNLMCLLASNNKFLSFIDGNNLPKNIRVLDISFNSLIDVPILSHLNNLLELNVSYNNLKALSPEISLIKSLAILNASGNCLRILPDDFGKLGMLKHLLLNNNLLYSLPSSFSELNLSSLNLSNNFFTSIPYEVSKVATLNTLFLKENLIESLFDLRCLNDILSPETINTLPESCEKRIELFKNLKYAYFDNNNLKKVTSAIQLMKNVRDLSFANNKIKTISEAFKELKYLTTLNLQNNKLQYLPICMKTLKDNVLTTLHLQENFIFYNDSEVGLGINGLINLQFIDLKAQSQYSTYIKVEDVVKNLQSQNYFWNIDVLKLIKLPVDISHYSTLISDKQMRKMWRVVFQYFIPKKSKRIEIASESSEEIIPEIEDKISQVVSTAAFYALKKNGVKVFNDVLPLVNCNASNSLRKRVSIFLREISIFSAGQVPNQANVLVKNYIKALFYKLLENVQESNSNLGMLENIKIALTDLCENKLFECSSGRLEGLQYYYSIYFANGSVAAYNPIVEYIRNIIASIKETTFVKVTNGFGLHGVHNICKWRPIFKKFLGITYLYKDPYDSQYLPINSNYKIGSVFNDFFNNFEVEVVCNEILDKINCNNIKVNESVDLLKTIDTASRGQKDDYISYMNVIKKYFEYDTLSAYDELVPKQLKKEGAIVILEYLQILTKNKTVESKH